MAPNAYAHRNRYALPPLDADKDASIPFHTDGGALTISSWRTTLAENRISSSAARHRVQMARCASTRCLSAADNSSSQYWTNESSTCFVNISSALTSKRHTKRLQFL